MGAGGVGGEGWKRAAFARFQLSMMKTKAAITQNIRLAAGTRI